MKKFFSLASRFSLLASFVFFGAGCSSFTSMTPVAPMASDSGTPSPEGLIAFKQGFGILPGKNPMPVDRASSNVAVNWKELPEINPEVTVIRKRTTMPNVTVVQNLTSAMNVPVGALQSKPSAKAMMITWDDEAGYRWTYDAVTDRLSFEKKNAGASLTSAKPVVDELLTQSASAFMKTKGLLVAEWGAPYAVFSWDKWWSERNKEGKCMSRATIEVIRKMALESSLDFDLLSSLAKKDSSDCVDPEFPNLQVIRYSFSQDGESVYERDGTPAIGGEAVVSMDKQEVIRGWIELKREADRSNYLAIQPDRLQAYLKNGGISDFPQNSKSYEISSFNRGAYRYIADVDGEKRTFYIPAIQAQGTLTYQNGSSILYAIVVPLTREDQFEGK